MNELELLSGQSNSESIIEGDTGVSEGSVLDLSLGDDEIIQIIGTRVENAESYWDKKLSLSARRKAGKNLYLNNTIDESKLYSHQVPYKNNRIFTAIETLIPMVVSQPAMPIVTEPEDTDSSRQLAEDLQNRLLAFYDDQRLKEKLTKVARHLFTGNRVGVLKYRFDPEQGELLEDGTRRGKIVVDVIQPEKLVIECRTGDIKDATLIAEYCSASVEELIARFPKKKKEILIETGTSEGSYSQLQKVITFMEVWFTYYQDGKRNEAVVWKYKQLVLDKNKNPNWNYEEFKTDEEKNSLVNLNFLERPEKPYVAFNHISFGEYVYDETALIDQSENQQKILNKRGRQIIENADAATGGKIIDSRKVNQEDAKKLTGDPNEILMVNGNPNQATGRFQTNYLPDYVVQSMYDARGEIDNVFGANAPIRGEKSGINTATQEVMSQRSNLGRLTAIADSLEKGMEDLYRGFIQMMKVYCDIPESIRFRNSEGKTVFLNYEGSKIEDGVQIRVKAGSILPTDKVALQAETMKLINFLDPLSIAEGLGKSDPQDFARRLFLYKYDIDGYKKQYIQDESEDTSNQARTDINATLGGQIPQPPQSPDKAYLFTLQRYLESEEFKLLTSEQQQGVYQLSVTANELAKKSLGIEGESEEAVIPEEQPQEMSSESMDLSQEQQIQEQQVQPQSGIIDRVRSLFKRK